MKTQRVTDAGKTVFARLADTFATVGAFGMSDADLARFDELEFEDALADDMEER